VCSHDGKNVGYFNTIFGICICLQLYQVTQHAHNDVEHALQKLWRSEGFGRKVEASRYGDKIRL
jgi:hypothetical protein